MKDDLVSVIIPTYRRDQELARALESAINQTYPYVEIILVDDNVDADWSRKVRAVVEEKTLAHPGVDLSYICNERHFGSAGSRNVGIRACKGNYVCFLDDDDIFSPKRVENQLRPMQNAGADYSITDLCLYNEQDELVEYRKRNFIVDREKLLTYHLMYHITGTDTLMFRKKYLLEIGGFGSIDIGDEFYLVTEAIIHGGKFIYVSVCDVKAYVHAGGIGLTSGSGKIQGEKQLYAFKRQFFPELDKAAIQYINMRHHAVLTYTYWKQKHILKFFCEGCRTVMSAPIQALSLLQGRLRGGKANCPDGAWAMNRE